MKTYGVTMEVSGVFHATVIAEENASPEKLKELALDAFEEADFGELCEADVESFKTYSDAFKVHDF